MKNLNKKKKIITCSVLLFSFLSITIFTNFNFESLFYKDDANKDDFTNFPKTSDSLPSFNGTGDKVNITLHQSYLNNSFNTALSPSDSNNNSFSLPCPTDTTFNSSYTKIKVENINAPNKTQNLELGTSGNSALGGFYWAFSFKVLSISILENFSICFSETSGNSVDAKVEIRLYNATDSGSETIPHQNTNLISIIDPISYGDNRVWYNYTNQYKTLDPSNTYNETFYIVFWDNTEPGPPDPISEFHSENDSSGDGDNSLVCRKLKTGGSWVMQNIDIASTVHIGLDDNTPKPTDINLRINDTTVSNDGNNNQGYWISQNEYSHPLGELNFTITAGWWDVTCEISQVQINYTKTDLRADSSFEVLESGQNVFWNVTKSGGLNYFDSRFNNYTINFTISSRWTNIEVWNGGTNKTDDIKPNYLNHYKDIQVFNAGNGTYWFLNATSSNLLTDIKKYVGTISVADTFNYTDLVRFNGTFSSSISDGSINLSVYNPLALNDQLNYTFVNSSFVSGKDIYFGDWNISDTVAKYGKFRILTQWNNGTDAGFFRDNITILAETNFLIDQPSQNTTFNSSTIFNVTITYRDREQDLDISDGDIYYKINSGTYSSVNESVTYIGSGKYNITFDCNNTEFNYGSNTITIRANNTYHNNQTGILNIIILGETNLSRPFPKTYNFDSGETFNITLYFNDTVKNVGINESTVVITVNGSAYTPLAFYDYGDGYYNITVNCSDDVFDDQGYGSFNLSINSEKINYYSQTTSFIIYIKGETSLTATKFPEPLKGYYNSDETFNITVFFNDTSRN